jgi:hypothetical protein
LLQTDPLHPIAAPFAAGSIDDIRRASTAQNGADVTDFEKLGAFYLGKLYDPEQRRTTDEILLYDSKDLTTHAVCVGMTGSGKTGLCISLLEEAAIDGIPALVIDPKGDLGNLALTFPELRPADFRPWIDESEAQRNGMTPDQYAARVAETWRQGLSQWGQDGARIARLRDAVELAIYTPGSSVGRPLRILRSFSAPASDLRADEEGLRDRIVATVSGLLSLLKIDADPLRSREHILLSNLLDRAWREGRDLDMTELIRSIQTPPFDRLGVVDLESFFPAAERFELAMRLNNVLASPAFASWMEGEPIEIPSLLHDAAGRPKLSILSIAHLSDSERIFFVTILLNEVIAWMRRQPGTSSLRAIVYMDEVFGYFPPAANPPPKTAMLTLLKQARAFGVGIVLATQNPVDLDYKGLSNAGTWFLGRLQTERDKLRVLDGLEGACASSGAVFDRDRMDELLSGLGNRVFVLKNAHEDGPVLFQTRWALSYLRGPLTRAQIQELAKRTPSPVPAAPPSTAGAPTTPAVGKARPVLGAGIEEFFLPASKETGEGVEVVYQPALLGSARLHFVDSKAGIDHWCSFSLLAPLDDRTVRDPWEVAQTLEDLPALASEARAAAFSPLPSEAAQAKSYAGWKKDLVDHLYRKQRLTLQYCPALKQYSSAGQSAGEFQVALRQLLRERRDLEIERLRTKHAPKLRQLQDRIRRAEQRVESERDQSAHQKLQAAVSLGATVIGALFGRKTSTLGRATTTVRGMARAAQQGGDVARAMDRVEDLNHELVELEAVFERESEGLRSELDPSASQIEEYPVQPRKSDIDVERVILVWTPWKIGKGGATERLF